MHLRQPGASLSLNFISRTFQWRSSHCPMSRNYKAEHLILPMQQISKARGITYSHGWKHNTEKRNTRCKHNKSIHRIDDGAGALPFTVYQVPQAFKTSELSVVMFTPPTSTQPAYTSTPLLIHLHKGNWKCVSGGIL